ncbi:22864_t:CDS:2 [Gigaspora margarita]|uniref:22864_t:CDS:1 n=1 Tax=Gigaspora margarita TaxID=4874 RepID=A0ABM8VWR8_GIGMA|nr:22864_t:CDS:2 [Gigaspora margarita]
MEPQVLTRISELFEEWKELKELANSRVNACFVYEDKKEYIRFVYQPPNRNFVALNGGQGTLTYYPNLKGTSDEEEPCRCPQFLTSNEYAEFTRTYADYLTNEKGKYPVFHTLDLEEVDSPQSQGNYFKTRFIDIDKQQLADWIKKAKIEKKNNFEIAPTANLAGIMYRFHSKKVFFRYSEDLNFTLEADQLAGTALNLGLDLVSGAAQAYTGGAISNLNTASREVISKISSAGDAKEKYLHRKAESKAKEERQSECKKTLVAGSAHAMQTIMANKSVKKPCYLFINKKTIGDILCAGFIQLENAIFEGDDGYYKNLLETGQYFYEKDPKEIFLTPLERGEFKRGILNDKPVHQNTTIQTNYKSAIGRDDLVHIDNIGQRDSRAFQEITNIVGDISAIGGGIEINETVEELQIMEDTQQTEGLAAFDKSIEAEAEKAQADKTRQKDRQKDKSQERNQEQQEELHTDKQVEKKILYMSELIIIKTDNSQELKEYLRQKRIDYEVYLSEKPSSSNIEKEKVKITNLSVKDKLIAQLNNGQEIEIPLE